MTTEDKDKVIRTLEERISLIQRTSGQNSARTLIDCINHFLQSCPNDCKVTVTMERHGHSLFVSRNGAHVFSVEGVRNLQVCYEVFLEFIIETHFYNGDGLPPASTIKANQ